MAAHDGGDVGWCPVSAPGGESGTDVLLDARLRYIIEASLAAMPTVERRRRVEVCQATGEHGVRASFEDDGVLLLTWGGSALARVLPGAFDDDGYFRPLELIPVDPPADASPLTGDDL